LSQADFRGEDGWFSVQTGRDSKQQLVVGVADGVGGSRFPGDEKRIVAGACLIRLEAVS
jgi:hypothetical protein